MLAIIIVSVVLGFILIFLVKRASSPIAMEDAYYQRESTPEGVALGSLLPEEFKELCVDLVEAAGLRVQSVESEEPGRIDILAEFDHPILGGAYLIHGLLSPTDQIVDSAPVIGLSNAVHHERAMKGIFITTGYFSQEVDKILEGAPVELINRDRLAQLIEAYEIGRAENLLLEQKPGENGQD